MVAFKSAMASLATAPLVALEVIATKPATVSAEHATLHVKVVTVIKFAMVPAHAP